MYKIGWENSWSLKFEFEINVWSLNRIWILKLMFKGENWSCCIELKFEFHFWCWNLYLSKKLDEQYYKYFTVVDRARVWSCFLSIWKELICFLYVTLTVSQILKMKVSTRIWSWKLKGHVIIPAEKTYTYSSLIVIKPGSSRLSQLVVSPVGPGDPLRAYISTLTFNIFFIREPT